MHQPIKAQGYGDNILRLNLNDRLNKKYIDFVIKRKHWLIFTNSGAVIEINKILFIARKIKTLAIMHSKNKTTAFLL